MALVQRPLATVLASEEVRSPRDLERRRVGVRGRPSDPALLRAVVRAAGGRPGTLRRRTTGPGAIRALLDGTVDAVVGFWPIEGVALRAARPRSRQFRVDEFGAPRYPELVLVAKRTTLQDTPAIVQGTVTALRRAYREVLIGPEEAVGALVDRVDGLERRVSRADGRRAPGLSAGGRGFGTLDVPALERWAAGRSASGSCAAPRRRADVRATRSRPGASSRAELLVADAQVLPAHGLGRLGMYCVSKRPTRTSRTASSPSMPGLVEELEGAVGRRGARRVPKRWAMRIRQCQSCLEYGWALTWVTNVAASM
jgi:hypothetical protein